MITQPKFQVRCGDADLRGYEVARIQLFTNSVMTSVTFAYDYIRFSSECVRKFKNVEYIELLVHPADFLFAVRPCSDNRKNAMRWAKIRADKVYVQEIRGTAFLGTLYELFKWNPLYKYRLRGEFLRLGDEFVVLFDAWEPEIIIPRKEVAAGEEDEFLRNLDVYDDIYIAAQSKRTFTALPLRWKEGFGINYYAHKNKRLLNILISDKFAEYNNQTELNPTALEIVEENIRQLINDMNRQGELDGNTTIFPE